MGKTEVTIIGLSSFMVGDHNPQIQYESICLDILQGKLKPKHWYFVDFHEKSILGHPDVILTMGSNEKQYFYELEK